MKKIYKSKISVWLFTILSIIFISITISFFVSSPPWYALFIIILAFSFILQIFVNTYYIIDNHILKIRSGFLYKLDVDIHQIKKIEETNSPLSSPAASFDRLEIIYNKFDSVLISPKHKAEFIKDVLSINSLIEVKYKQ